MVEIVTAVYREPVKNYLANFFSIWGEGRGWGTDTEKFRDELSHSGVFFYIFLSGECYMKNEVCLEKLALII